VLQFRYSLVPMAAPATPSVAGLYALKFTGDLATLTVPGSVTWVDAHVSINNVPMENYRMDRISEGVFQTQGTANAGLSLRGGDTVRFFFSYCVGQSDCCDSEPFTLTA